MQPQGRQSAPPCNFYSYKTVGAPAVNLGLRGLLTANLNSWSAWAWLLSS